MESMIRLQLQNQDYLRINDPYGCPWRAFVRFEHVHVSISPCLHRVTFACEILRLNNLSLHSTGDSKFVSLWEALKLECLRNLLSMSNLTLVFFLFFLVCV